MQHRRRRRRHVGRREEFAYVLDYMPLGNPTDRHEFHRNRPVAQLIGEKYFTLLEASPHCMGGSCDLEIGQRVYIGPVAKAEEQMLQGMPMAKVDAEIGYEDLTSVAKEMLPQIVETIIRKHEQVFVTFFNIADIITLRFHSLELLPGVGKKTVQRIISAREERPFESFEDIRRRARIDPVKVLTERILSELRGEEKYYLFVKPPKKRRGEAQAVQLDYLDRIYEMIRERRSEHEEAEA